MASLAATLAGTAPMGLAKDTADAPRLLGSTVRENSTVGCTPVAVATPDAGVVAAIPNGLSAIVNMTAAAEPSPGVAVMVTLVAPLASRRAPRAASSSSSMLAPD